MRNLWLVLCAVMLVGMGLSGGEIEINGTPPDEVVIDPVETDQGTEYEIPFMLDFSKFLLGDITDCETGEIIPPSAIYTEFFFREGTQAPYSLADLEWVNVRASGYEPYAITRFSSFTISLLFIRISFLVPAEREICLDRTTVVPDCGCAETELEGAMPLVHCVVENYSFLLPEAICGALGGTLWQDDFLVTEYPAPEWDCETTSLCGLLTEADDTCHVPAHTARLTVEADTAARTAHARITVPVHDVVPNIAVIGVRHILDPEGEYHTSAVVSHEDFFNGEAVITLSLAEDAGYGRHEVALTAAFDDNRQAFATAFVDLPLEDAPLPPFDDPNTLDTYVFFSSILLSSIQDEIDRISEAQRATGRALRDAQEEMWRLTRGVEDSTHSRNELERALRALERENRILEELPGVYGERTEALLDKLDCIPDLVGVPSDADLDALEDSLSRAQSAVRACEARKAELERRIGQLEEQAAEYLARLHELLAEQHAIWMRYDCVGAYGVRDAAGRAGGAHWGYVCNETPPFGSEDYNRLVALRTAIRGVESRWQQVRQTIAQLQEVLEEAREECNSLEQEADAAAQNRDQAWTARERQESYDAQRVQLKAELISACREIQALLAGLRQWCNDHPPSVRADRDNRRDIDALRHVLRRRSQCPPADREHWDAFWTDFEELITLKKQIESRLRARIAELRTEISRLERNVEEARGPVGELEQEYNRWARELSEARAMREAELIAEETERCIVKFVEWLKENEQHLENTHISEDAGLGQAAAEFLRSTVEAIGEGVATRAGNLARGATALRAGALGAAKGVFTLGASIFYAWAAHRIEGIIIDIMTDITRQLVTIQACDHHQRDCGRLPGERGASFFFFREGNTVLLFQISPGGGLELLGEGKC